MDNTASELNLSGKNLKKLTKPTPEECLTINTLLLDNNELQKLDNIDSYVKLQKLCVSKNQLLRMYGVCRLSLLTHLDLSHNGILVIEGILNLVHLTYLNLAGNKIKVIEHLNTNVELETLDLSYNNVLHVSDLSPLKKLKELYLHGNNISHLRQCDKFLPTSLHTLTLAKNNLTDLNEICSIGHLAELVSFSIEGNPCVCMTGNNVGFDYRPFIINWCMSVKVIDGYVVNAFESLKAEWLYSQGRGRQFGIGEQQSLCRYLASTCPLSEQALETEDHRKLRLILSKAQHHQKQLLDEMTSSTGSITPSTCSPSPASSRRLNSRINSPRIATSRLSGRSKSPNRMTNSYHGAIPGNGIYQTTNAERPLNHHLNITSQNIMCQSLDSALIMTNVANATNQSIVNNNGFGNGHSTPLENMKSAESHQIINDNYDLTNPLHAATKLVPVPESLMSPDVQPVTTAVKTGLHHNVVNQNIQNTGNYNSRIPHMPKNVGSPKGSPKMSRSPRPKSSIDSSAIRNSQNSYRNTPSPGRKRKPMLPQLQKSNAEILSSESVPSSDDDDNSNIQADKLQAIRQRANTMRQQQKPIEQPIATDTAKSNLDHYAVVIQKIWRGFRTRNLGKTKHIARVIQDSRMKEYIVQLTSDMAATKTALESERKIQQLQMQAISALWRKVAHMPSSSGDMGDSMGPMEPTQTAAVPKDCGDQNVIVESQESDKAIQDLEVIVKDLQSQVKDLQMSMNDVKTYMNHLLQNPTNRDQKDSGKEISTQTDIVAVHTPQGDCNLFPFNNKLSRPSTLLLPNSQQTQTINTNTTTQTQTTSPAEHDNSEPVSDFTDNSLNITEIHLATEVSAT